MTTPLSRVSSSCRYYYDEAQTLSVTMTCDVFKVGNKWSVGSLTVASVEFGIAHAGVLSGVITLPGDVGHETDPSSHADFLSKRFKFISSKYPRGIDAEMRFLLTVDKVKCSGGFRIVRIADNVVLFESGPGEPIPQIQFAQGSTVSISG